MRVQKSSQFLELGACCGATINSVTHCVVFASFLAHSFCSGLFSCNKSTKNSSDCKKCDTTIHSGSNSKVYKNLAVCLLTRTLFIHPHTPERASVRKLESVFSK